MRISSINNLNSNSFKGRVLVYGKVNIGIPNCKTEDDIKNNSEKIEKIFTGKSMKYSLNSFAQNNDDTTKALFPFVGYITFDTDRVTSISNKGITLASEDGAYNAAILYNETGKELRQLVAITAYEAAARNNISTYID